MRLKLWRGAPVTLCPSRARMGEGGACCHPSFRRVPGGGGVSGWPAKHWAMAIQALAGSPITTSREAAIPLPEIKCRLAMADVYDGVTIEG